MMVTQRTTHLYRINSKGIAECGRHVTADMRLSSIESDVTCKTCLNGHVNSPLQNEAYIMSRMLGNVEMARRCLFTVARHLDIVTTVTYANMCDSLHHMIKDQYEAKKKELRK